MDKELEEIIAQLPKLTQRQYDRTTQLLYLSKIAIKLGLFDADDSIKITPPSTKKRGIQ